MQEVMGEEVHAKFAELKLAQAERCPKALGTLIKASEVQFTTRSRTCSQPLVSRTAGGPSSRRASSPPHGLRRRESIDLAGELGFHVSYVKPAICRASSTTARRWMWEERTVTAQRVSHSFADIVQGRRRLRSLA